jgi:hypothetical protein
MNDDNAGLVTVAVSDNATEAALYRETLEQAGITAFVADAGIVSMNWLWATAVGGIKVQVSRELGEDAAQLLSARAEAVDPEESALLAVASEICPACGTSEIGPYRGTQARNIVLGIATYFLLAFPLLLRETRLQCIRCGHRFQRA